MDILFSGGGELGSSALPVLREIVPGNNAAVLPEALKIPLVWNSVKSPVRVFIPYISAAISDVSIWMVMGRTKRV